MVIPRSRSNSMLSRNWSCASRAETVPVFSSSRSERVLLPWSMCAMIEKLRRCAFASGIGRGPYRFTRNPMYVGLTLLTLGIGGLLARGWIVLLAPAALIAVHFLAVLPEERYLAAKFGDSYVLYKTRVRRYL